MSSPTEFGRRGATTAAAATYGAVPKHAKPAPSSHAPSGPSPLAPLLEMFFSFDGRLRRRDYWFAHITVTVASLLYLWFDISMQLSAKGNLAVALPLALLSLGLSGVMLWSDFAIQVKRWHDRDKSWFWLFIGFIPLLGGLWMFVELGCLDGTPGDNRFGHSPKLGPAAVFA
jgi:uncharacterized membrane protein YhaH (DUF805 family)